MGDKKKKLYKQIEHLQSTIQDLRFRLQQALIYDKSKNEKYRKRIEHLQEIINTQAVRIAEQGNTQMEKNQAAEIERMRGIIKERMEREVRLEKRVEELLAESDTDLHKVLQTEKEELDKRLHVSRTQVSELRRVNNALTERLQSVTAQFNQKSFERNKFWEMYQVIKADARAMFDVLRDIASDNVNLEKPTRMISADLHRAATQTAHEINIKHFGKLTYESKDGDDS